MSKERTARHSTGAERGKGKGGGARWRGQKQEEAEFWEELGSGSSSDLVAELELKTLREVERQVKEGKETKTSSRRKTKSCWGKRS